MVSNDLLTEKEYKKAKLFSECEYILGRPIFEHKLICNNAKAVAFLNSCINIHQVVEYLHKLHAKKNKKQLNLPSHRKGRRFYNIHKWKDKRANKRSGNGIVLKTIPQKVSKKNKATGSK